MGAGQPPVITITPPTPGSTSSGTTSTKKKSTGTSKGGGANASYLNALEQVYIGLWGLPAPPGYIEKIGASHMNMFEFEAHERAKPAFKMSPKYAEDYLSTGLQVAKQLGSLG